MMAVPSSDVYVGIKRYGMQVKSMASRARSPGVNSALLLTVGANLSLRHIALTLCASVFSTVKWG